MAALLNSNVLDHDEQEEGELEAMLFGHRRPTKLVERADDSTSGDEDTGLGWMQDHELFSIDVKTSGVQRQDTLDDEGNISEYSIDEEPTIEYLETTSAESRPAKRPKILWKDPADELLSVKPTESKRLRKLARGKRDPTSLTGIELQNKLKDQFESLHPRPDWASRRQYNGTSTIQHLLQSTKSFVAVTNMENQRSPLPPNFIDIQRLPDANKQSPTPGKKQASNSGLGIVDFSWHPSHRDSVMAVAGGDKRVRLFNIDGHTNAPLLSLYIPSLPLARSTFHPSGSSILLAGSRPFFYTYDLAAQVCVRSNRNIFGSTPSPSSPQSLSRHAFSPDGSLLAVAGRRGCVSLVEWSHGGSTGVVIGELKSGRGGSVSDMVWNDDGSELSVLGGRHGAEVEVWSIAERQVIRKWQDDRAFGGVLMRRCPSNFLAIGSSTGIVNLYQSESLSPSTERSVKNRDPYKSLEHLTTPVTAMDFHPSGELFASASAAKKDSLKLYHLPSGTAFSNWPTSATPLGRVSALGFSSGGDYLAAGNTKGSVLLWSLKHFAN